LPKLPEPPDLKRIPPLWYDLPTGSLLWRLYSRGGGHSITWNHFRTYGPLSTARFDHHFPPAREQERGILYLALSGPTCLAEAFQASRTIDVWHNEPWLVAFETTRPLRLLDLSGAWVTQAGGSMAINSGRRDRARRWSQAIYAAYSEAKGLWYPSSMDANRPCVTLDERAADSLPIRPAFHAALADPTLAVVIQNSALRFGYRLVSAPRGR
jgi:hypothetical protein